MSTITIDNERLQVVKHLAAGKSIDVTATITRLPKDRVLDIASHHGYPDREKLGKAAELMTARLDREATALPERAPEPLPRQISSPKPPPPDPSLTKPDEIRVLLNTAKAHPSKRIQNAANRVFDQIGKLRDLIAEDEQKHAAKRAESAAKEKARARIKALEAEIAAEKAKLRGKPVASATDAPRATTAPKGEYPCRNEGCDEIKDTGQGRSMHERFHCPHRADVAS